MMREREALIVQNGLLRDALDAACRVLRLAQLGAVEARDIRRVADMGERVLRAAAPPDEPDAGGRHPRPATSDPFLLS